MMERSKDEYKMKPFVISNINRIGVVGSLSPDKQCQDRVRILDAGGVSQALRATDFKDPPKILVYEK